MKALVRLVKHLSTCGFEPAAPTDTIAIASKVLVAVEAKKHILGKREYQGFIRDIEASKKEKDMSDKGEEKSFRELINEDCPDDPLTEEEAMFALHNLSEFIWLLYKINEREKIIPLDVLSGKMPMPDTEPTKEALVIKRG